MKIKIEHGKFKLIAENDDDRNLLEKLSFSFDHNRDNIINICSKLDFTDDSDIDPPRELHFNLKYFNYEPNSTI